jgi:hypothetical protein
MPFPRETGCPVYKQRCEAIELLFGSGLFRFQRRLTGFGGARKIVRIRTNTHDVRCHLLDAA